MSNNFDSLKTRLQRNIERVKQNLAELEKQLDQVNKLIEATTATKK